MSCRRPCSIMLPECYPPFILSLILLNAHAGAIGFFGIPGQYCSLQSPSCCPSRNDDCTRPILGNHLCYCDMFCSREDGNDCCPDFREICLHQPPLTSDRGCEENGIQYGEDQVIKRNCNKCKCKNDKWVCDAEICLIQPSLLQKVQQGRFSWSARNYSKFWGETLVDGIRHRLGTLFPEESVKNMNEILIKPRELPARFDAREKWPLYIHPVRDQGNCASSWSMSTTATSADRLSIISDGRFNVSLSAQQLLSCNQHRQKGCEGGYLDRAWWYIRKLGVVSEECYPYESGITQIPGECQISKSTMRRGGKIRCPSQHHDNAVYRMTPPYRVSSREEDIMSEVMTNGPVQATFLVHEDFFMYSGGVYNHIQDVGPSYTAQGYHSVRILGWGEDESTGRSIKYWLAANSWGPEWGENGLFRIVRGENHCEIESFVIGAWGKGGKKRRRFRMKKMKRRSKSPLVF
ncbi:hypothetical protein AB6A40_000946 [Gnathostoma spinigerum]|uniref:SMB domain-containing protein n=1 Tax=Gnathostoma spinigerum TaxID=75299 RepID=A0ABD6EC20_9BILA